MEKIEDDHVVLLAEGREYKVPVSEVFLGVEHPLVSPGHAVFRHPFQFALKDKAVFVVDQNGAASRSKALQSLRQEILAIRDDKERRLDVKVLEIRRRFITAVDRRGLPIRISTAETVAHLRTRFHRRLRPYVGEKRGDEAFWLYPGDRIWVQVDQDQEPSHCPLAARIVARNLVAPELTPAEIEEETKSLFILPYESVVCASDNPTNDNSAIAKELNCKLHTVLSPQELGSWGLNHAAMLTSDSHRMQPGQEICLLLLNCASRQSADAFLRESLALADYGTRFDIVALYKKTSAAHDRAEAWYNNMPQILGVWDPDTGIYELSAIITHGIPDSPDGLNPCDGPIPGDQPHNAGGAKLGQAGTAGAVMAQMETQLHDLLKSLVSLASGPEGRNCVLVFSIDRGGHSVQIEHAHGNETLMRGFQAVKTHLHKSPVRDLAISGLNSDTDKGAELRHRGRFLYFLDAVVGNAEEAKGTDLSAVQLSCRGFNLGSMPFDHRLRVCFLVTDRDQAFLALKDPQTQAFLNVQVQALRALLLARHLWSRVDAFQSFAVAANDFSFLAHEISVYLDRASRQMSGILTKGSPDNRDLEEVASLLSEAGTTCTQLFPSHKSKMNPVSVKLSDLITRIADAEDIIIGKSDIKLQIDISQTSPGSLRLRHLILGCALRNIISNARHQIRDYCGGKGTIILRFRTETDERLRHFLVVEVSDNGPGIHARYQNRIFDAGFTNRKEGRGLGLAAIRRAFEKQDWGAGGPPEVKLQSSLLYNSTTFILRFPVEIN